ncbi:hypothetical protein TcarDRAFT_1623 [Thermosinus carboxydivorans Nor1]|uniref:DUF4911 domain-containing protein n=1 Tax=Thermosinus carboxydivorans Nor1 TaxID=401526 RepID=A1HQ87_9FIRM|nr:DUF4911 domain-containing protein [Thermosinus carboxydivorans]EAX47934.1 hypothetical protein TcarDRAFT_1623 [Thermosinus carboxydivorans Nor1]
MAESVYIRVAPQYINFVNQIMEGYEYLGVVTTVNRTEGLLVVRATPDTCADVREILRKLPLPIEFV